MKLEFSVFHVNLANLFLYRLGSRFRVNETSQISDRYSVQMKAAMKQNRLVILGQMYLSMIEYPKHYYVTETQHLATKGCAKAVLRPEFSS